MLKKKKEFLPYKPGIDNPHEWIGQRLEANKRIYKTPFLKTKVLVLITLFFVLCFWPWVGILGLLTFTACAVFFS